MNGKNLIVNADDFGLSKSINLGIVKSFTEGIVTRASLMANGPEFEEACHLALKHKIPVGLHANFTAGVPILPQKSVRTIVSGFGQFLSKWQFVKRYFCRQISLLQIYNEAESQIQKMLNAGININHLDSHHHIHSLSDVNIIFRQLAQKYSIHYIRTVSFPTLNVLKTGGATPYLQQAFVNRIGQSVKSQNYPQEQQSSLIGFEFFFTKNKCVALEQMFSNLYDGKWELLCHPAVVLNDDNMPAHMKMREQERLALCDKEVLQSLNRNKILLISN